MNTLSNSEAIEVDQMADNGALEYLDEVPFVDLKRQYNQNKYEIKLAINRVLASGIYTLGPETDAFEREFAAYHQVPYCVGVSSGTEAVEIGLRALGIKKGDGVITVANAGMHSTSAIRNIGAIPQFVDIDRLTMTMSSESLTETISPRTRAIVVTHLYGRVADLESISEIAKRFDLHLVEDCFLANGANFDGKMVGTWGDVGCFCFSPTRNLGALGEAGAILTSDVKIARKARDLRKDGFNLELDPNEFHSKSSLMNEIQAAILRAKLPMLDEWNLKRRMIAQTYNIHLDRSNSNIQFDYQNDGSVFQLFVVRIPKRDYVKSFLESKEIGSAIHYAIPDHWWIAGLNSNYSRFRLPETEKASAEVLSLPCYPELTSWEIEQVCVTVNESLNYL
ncbi:MAG: DegT/DnrJ/EryC1/StrS family aminotransferase [Chloroflexota bacterium]|nr:MAG: DegT/DnrJ/EryC1/StrS family aminotransferase [Chloroflexota bacterium]